MANAIYENEFGLIINSNICVNCRYFCKDANQCQNPKSCHFGTTVEPSESCDFYEDESFLCTQFKKWFRKPRLPKYPDIFQKLNKIFPDDIKIDLKNRKGWKYKLIEDTLYVILFAYNKKTRQLFSSIAIRNPEDKFNSEIAYKIVASRLEKTLQYHLGE